MVSEINVVRLNATNDTICGAHVLNGSDLKCTIVIADSCCVITRSVLLLGTDESSNDVIYCPQELRSVLLMFSILFTRIKKQINIQFTHNRARSTNIICKYGSNYQLRTSVLLFCLYTTLVYNFQIGRQTKRPLHKMVAV